MLTQKILDETVDFHGHKCPGLAIGIRAAEHVMNALSDRKNFLIAVTETDMCAVDAIQYILGCTFGKGNLIYQDHGKKAFSFFDPENGRSLRLLYKDNASIRDLDKIAGYDLILKAPFDSIFSVGRTKVLSPSKARIFSSVVCARCKESVMETRLRRGDGVDLCIPCYEDLFSIKKAEDEPHRS